MVNWLTKSIGEMSRLRNNIVSMLGGTVHASYKLDSSRVDYELAKQLYDNTHDNYKLGAGFAKSIVNTKVSFMGTPAFVSVDKEAQAVLDAFVKNNKKKMSKTHLRSLREGDAFVWITREDNKNKSLYPEQKTRLVYNIIPPGQVKDIILDPVTNEPIEYVLESTHEWTDDGSKKKATITQRIGVGYRKIEIEGDVPSGMKKKEEIPTPWDFIPIIHFKNEADEGEKFGRSEIEAIEPFLKAYHDVMLHAMQGSKMHSTPRLKLGLKDVKGFLRNNFGIEDPLQFAKEGKTINLDGHEILILASDEKAEFIEAKSATGDAAVLLKFLFYCIVDTSETPEFVFGVHTPSSQASVKEQMPVLIRNIERKRSNFADNWQMLARIVLAMSSYSENVQYSTYETTLVWDKIDPRSGEEIADELKTTVEALVLAINNNLISHEAAVTYLSEFVETMHPYESENKDIEGEKERIFRTRLEKERLSDTEYLEQQLKKIDQLLNRKVG